MTEEQAFEAIQTYAKQKFVFDWSYIKNHYLFAVYPNAIALFSPDSGWWHVFSLSKKGRVLAHRSIVWCNGVLETHNY